MLKTGTAYTQRKSTKPRIREPREQNQKNKASLFFACVCLNMSIINHQSKEGREVDRQHAIKWINHQCN